MENHVHMWVHHIRHCRRRMLISAPSRVRAVLNECVGEGTEQFSFSYSQADACYSPSLSYNTARLLETDVSDSGTLSAHCAGVRRTSSDQK